MKNFILDYEAETTQQRLDIVNKILSNNMAEIIEHFDTRFNCHPNMSQGLSDSDRTCHQLELMADYILYGEKKQSDINTSSRQRTVEKHEGICLEELVENDIDIIEDTRKFKKDVVTKDDLKKYPEIRRIFEQKEFIKNKNKNRITRGISTSLNYSMMKLKHSLSGQFNFRTSPSTPMYVFDNDTGYFKDDDYILVSENTIDLANPKHIFELINNYASLVDSSLEDSQSDIKHILYVLEETINKTNLLQHMFDILVWKIDGLTAPQIINALQIKHGLVVSESRLSTLYRDIIPQKISEVYKDDYEDWLYTYKIRGAWKKCSQCQEIKLANDKNFGKHPNTKDNFQSICKKCDNLRKNE